MSNLSPFEGHFEDFRELCRKHSHFHIAHSIGLHKNTVTRWALKGEVPRHYAADFKRLLNYPYRASTPKESDQYYTRPAVASQCYRTFRKVAEQELGVNLRRYCFIEPSAGCGCFYNLLPKARRIGVDIEPKIEGLIEVDFLTWRPPQGRKYRYIVLGNPPFGLRGHLALQFINHASQFADLVGFILPQLFNSDGKGVPGKRVLAYKLAYSEKLPSDSFHNPSGAPVHINTVFQVWSKIHCDKIQTSKPPSCASYVRIYSLSDGGTPASTRNKAMIGKCDVYIPSTCYSGMRAYRCFADLPNQRGYGVLVQREKRAIAKLLLRHSWQETAFPSTNSALNIRRSLIEGVVIGGGYQDERKGR